MQTNLASMITYAYHFLSEAMIIFLIALPFFHHRFLFVPYGSYFVVIVVTCVVFTFIYRYSNKNSWFVLFIPVLFFVFFILDYPIVFAVAFSMLLVWRYIDIKNEELISRENLYILFTLLLTAVISILVVDSRIMIYPFLQFVILFIGYITSQMIIVNKDDRKQLDLKLPLYFVGILGLGAAVFFFIFEVLRNVALNIGQGFLNAIGGVIRSFSDVLSFLTVEQRGWPEQTTDDDINHGDGYWNELQEYNVVEGMSIFLVLGIGILLLAVVTFFVIILWKKRAKKNQERVENSKAVSYSALSTADPNQAISRSLFHRFFNKPNDPIRKLVYQLERKAMKSKKGRKSFETIEDWFIRIGVPSNITIYQKVRYGEKRASDEEVKVLKSQLKEIEAKLEG